MRLSCSDSPSSRDLNRSSSVTRPRDCGQLGVALARLPPLSDLPGHPVLRDDEEVVARARHGGQAEDHAPDGDGPASSTGRRARRASRGPGRTPRRPRSSRRRATCRAGRARSPPGRDRGRGEASIATPWACWSGLARRSSDASAVRMTASSRSSMSGAPLGGDVDEHRLAAVLLGHQAVLGQLAAHLRRVGALLVDLVDRDDDRHAAAWAWLSASMVCGFTPSSAATTSTAMSVTCAPRARMAVNASWPGVSMNVIFAPRRRARRDLVGTDVLGDAAGLARDHVRRRGSHRGIWSCRGRRDP